jgi:hypothetical protein
MESFEEILKKLGDDQYDVIETWLYNSKDQDLEQALKVIDSRESLKVCNFKTLKKYQVFIKLLLQGQLASPPSHNSDPNPSNLRNITLSCNLLTCSISNLLKKKIYSQIFRLFSVILLKSQNPSLNFRKVFHFNRKLENIEFFMSSKLKTLKKSIFSRLSFKSRQIRLKKKKKSLEEIRNFSKGCIWIMIQKGKLLNEQLSFWKWKIGEKVQKQTLQTFFKVFWTKQSRIINLLRMIAINCNTRTLAVLKKNFFHWREVQEEWKFIDFREMQIETILNNFENLLEFKVFNQLNTFFHVLKTKSKKMRTKQEKFSFKKSVFFNILQIFRKNLKKVMKTWSKPVKKKTIVEVTQLGSVQKPLIIPQKSQKLSCLQRLSLRSLSLLILQKIQHIWWILLREKCFQQEATLSSNETTMDLSNFLLPPEKCLKLRLIMNHLIQIITYKRNMKYLVFNEWLHEGQKRSLTILNIQQIINKQQVKIKAKQKAFAELVIASQYPFTFTDVD